jgi:hypothetical protein
MVQTPQLARRLREKGGPKGARNNLTRDVKARILAALNAKGGQKWLEQQAAANPVASARQGVANAGGWLRGRADPTQRGTLRC